jgi:PAS domain-containing protein
VKGNRELAAWLISRRNEIENQMNLRLGPAAPAISSPEAEALRRFRSYVAAFIQRGAETAPALDGLRLNQRRTEALLVAWVEAAAGIAGDEAGPGLRNTLTPLVDRFRVHIRSTGNQRKSRGTPRAKRRAVMAAIDRLSEAFIAIDTDTGTIEDANPAAGSLLGLDRDALLGVDAMSFVPVAARASWWTELDAVGEGDESRCFEASMIDTRGSPLGVNASATRFATRDRTLALILMRPCVLPGSPPPPA